MKILVLNAGSSSLKYQFIDMETEQCIAKGLCDRIGIADGFFKQSAHKTVEQSIDIPDHATAIKLVLKYLTDPEYGVISDMSEIAAVGHRVVNGSYFLKSMLLDKATIDAIEGFTDFAPLHNPPAVTVMRACVAIMGDTPQTVVFDTSFHCTMPDVAKLYPLPEKYYKEYGIRRFGAHGTSHKFVANEYARRTGKDISKLKLVTCHLGNGSSITAVDGGVSVDTSMGFTPLAGVMMGTRCGDIDPAIVTFIMDKEGLSTAEMNALMNKQSGALAVSGFSSDFRDIEEAANERGDERAILVLDMLAYQVSKYIGAYAMAMGGIDAIIFTAGLGENNKTVRRYIAKRLGFIGAYLDEEKNNVRGEYRVISTDDSKVELVVVPTNEELAIAKDTMELVKGIGR